MPQFRIFGLKFIFNLGVGLLFASLSLWKTPYPYLQSRWHILLYAVSIYFMSSSLQYLRNAQGWLINIWKNSKIGISIMGILMSISLLFWTITGIVIILFFSDPNISGIDIGFGTLIFCAGIFVGIPLSLEICRVFLKIESKESYITRRKLELEEELLGNRRKYIHYLLPFLGRGMTQKVQEEFCSAKKPTIDLKLSPFSFLSYQFWQILFWSFIPVFIFIIIPIFNHELFGKSLFQFGIYITLTGIILWGAIVFLYLKKSKLSINEKGIRFSGILKEAYFLWGEIKNVYVDSDLRVRLVFIVSPPLELDPQHWSAPKIIYEYLFKHSQLPTQIFNIEFEEKVYKILGEDIKDFLISYNQNSWEKLAEEEYLNR